MRDPRAILADLARGFPPHNPAVPGLRDPDTLRFYLEQLADVPPPLLDAAVTSLIRAGGKYLPNVSAIREAAAELLLALPGEAAALAQVQAVVDWNRQPETSRGPAPEVHPLIRQTVAALGGYYAFRTSDRPHVLVSQFCRLYADTRAAALREVRHGNLPLPAAPARPALTEGDPR